MRCACGYTKFLARLKRSVLPKAPRWCLIDKSTTYGLGSAPLGTDIMHGAQTWGRVDVDVNVGVLETRCASCTRTRHARTIGGGTVLGSWQGEGSIFMLMSDVVAISCVTAKLRGEGAEHTLPMQIVEAEELPVLDDIAELTMTLPPGAIVGDVVYCAILPKDLQGSYRLILVDRCLRATTIVGTFVLGA